ncbi:MAG: O-antigen ligase family protein [Clostridia bacterium]|nr:O-antigen ligase family protein [Clostridia bacterium]
MSVETTAEAKTPAWIAYCKKQWKRFTALLHKDWYRATLALSVAFLVPEYIAVALVFVSAFFLFRAVKKEGLKLQFGKLGILLLLYIGTAFISISYALDPLHSMWMSLLWLAMFIGYLVVSTVLTTRSRFRVALQTLACVATVCGLISILQYVLNAVGCRWMPLNLWYPLDKAIFDLFTDQLILTWEGNRTAATFNNPNLYAKEMVIMLPLLAHCLLTAGRKNERLLYSGMLAIAAVGALFTFSRGGYLALLLVLLVFLVLNFARSKVARWAVLFICLGAVAFVLIPNPFMDRLASISFEDKAVALRLDAWQVAWESFLERPIGGYGVGSFNALELIQNSGIKETPHFHNVVLELLIEGGLIAIVIYALMAWQVFIPNLKLHHVEDWNDRTLGVTFLAIACGFLLAGMVDFPMSTPKGILSFILILGFSDCANHLCGIQPTYPLKRRK